MGSFENDTWHVYINEEMKERRDEILDHLQENYSGPGDFVQQKMNEEQALNIEERIKRKEQDLEQDRKDLEQLKQIKKDRNQASILRDKKELLKEKQKKLQKQQKSPKTQLKTGEELREEVIDELWSSYPFKSKNSTPSTREEYVKQKQDKIEKKIKRKKLKRENDLDVDELVEEVERLQSEIKDLNNGEALDCFLSISQEVQGP